MALFIGPDSRECGTCHEVKSYDGFTPRGNGKYKSTCKACAAARMRQWAKDNAERHARTRHAWDLRNLYGTTPEHYAAMHEAQGGKCAICREEPKARHGTNGATYRLSLDHCHDTGRVRGLLCNDCNRAIGLLKDDPSLLREAINYLERGSGYN